MSSDLCIFDDFCFSPFADSTIDFLQDPIFENPEEEISGLDQVAPTIFENLSISPKPIFQNHLNVDTQFPEFSNFEVKKQSHLQDPFFQNTKDEASNLHKINHTELEEISVFSKPNSQNYLNFDTQLSDFSNLEVQKQDYEIPVNYGLGYESFEPHSYGGAENVERFMQRSYSSSSFNVNPHPGFWPNFDFKMENQNFENQIMGSCATGQMRRTCSTGDLQVTRARGTQGLCSSSPLGPLGVENSFIEETNFKMGRYSAEERKERIHKYRSKRNQRNFNKTIKYACRKTLADNRPRIRGRFARNDDTADTPKTPNFYPYEDDESWVDGYTEEERTVKGGTVFNIMGLTQFQYHGFSQN